MKTSESKRNLGILKQKLRGMFVYCDIAQKKCKD